jgi:CMP-N-acetylneuraminic acid synthetase/regulator of RNase E activity RraA
MREKVVAFVPAKGTSERVFNKNLQIFNGEPFFMFTVRKLLACNLVDIVVVDSDDDEILDLARRAGAETLRRDKALASNRTDGNELFRNEIRHFSADIYIQHLCTSPFVREDTIDYAIKFLQKNADFDSVVLGNREKRYEWSKDHPLYDIRSIPNSVDLDYSYKESMGFYAIRAAAAEKTGRRIGGSPKLIFGKPIENVDVNEPDDLDFAKLIAGGLLEQETRRLRVLSRLLTSPVLSDLCDELGLHQVLDSTYFPNYAEAKILGRARPLYIREAKKNDPPGSIYKALQSYKTMFSNDVIIVKTEIPNLAYFGDLNMGMALRSGAVGAIIGGVTRDNRATTAASFPVFSKGRFCKDVKTAGAVKSYNEAISLDGVDVFPNDLIFADVDGVVVIPRQYETEIFRKAVAALKNEALIRAHVTEDVEPDELISKFGFF